MSFLNAIVVFAVEAGDPGPIAPAGTLDSQVHFPARNFSASSSGDGLGAAGPAAPASAAGLLAGFSAGCPPGAGAWAEAAVAAPRENDIRAAIAVFVTGGSSIECRYPNRVQIPQPRVVAPPVPGACSRWTTTEPATRSSPDHRPRGAPVWVPSPGVRV